MITEQYLLTWQTVTFESANQIFARGIIQTG